jgi:hypothetical protein
VHGLHHVKQIARLRQGGDWKATAASELG